MTTDPRTWLNAVSDNASAAVDVYPYTLTAHGRDSKKLYNTFTDHLPAITSALIAVLDLHKPKPPTEHGTECWECSNPSTWAVWPCATVRAIQDAMEDIA